jgi:hypothetical protein
MSGFVAEKAIATLRDLHADGFLRRGFSSGDNDFQAPSISNCRNTGIFVYLSCWSLDTALKTVQLWWFWGSLARQRLRSNFGRGQAAGRKPSDIQITKSNISKFHISNGGVAPAYA